jgi:hypothetical protein
MQRALDSLAPKAPAATPSVDYSTGLYNDLLNRPDSAFPPGTAYTDKKFTRDVFGRVISSDAPLKGGSTTSLNTALARQNPIAGSDMQRALDSVYPSTPVAGVHPETDWSKIDAAINQMFSEPNTSDPGRNEITGETTASPEGVARSIGLPAGSIAPLKPTNALGEAGAVFPGDAANFYGSNADRANLPGSINESKRQIAALVQQQEYAAKDYMQVGSNLGFDHPITQEYKAEVDKLNDQINDWNNGVLQREESSKIIQSNPVHPTNAYQLMTVTDAGMII